MNEHSLKEEFKYYMANQSDLVSLYSEKYIVIKDKEVVGVYDSEIEAYQEAQKTNILGTFLIQFVSAGQENHTQTFYSQVAF